MNQVPLVKIS